MANIITPTVEAPAPLDPARKDPELTDAARDGGPVPYIQRKIDVTFALGTGQFGEDGSNTVTLRGHRCYVTVSKAATGAPETASVRIWGMSFSLMLQLSAYGVTHYAQRKNQVLIEAGDDVSGMTMVFGGVMQNAYFDGNSQPDVAFQVQANSTDYVALKPAPPISIAGSVDVATVMKGLADQMGLTFENHGVDAKLRDVYYPGTAYQQARRIAEHSGIGWSGIESGTMAIWPRGQGRDTGTIALFSPESGMKDYPTFNEQGVIVTSLFRPVKMMQQVAIKSSIFADPKDKAQTPRTYNYFVFTYTYTLESEAPNGPWFVTFQASNAPLYG
jgi:hypothetical protein